MVSLIKSFFLDVFDRGATSQQGTYDLLIVLSTLSTLLMPYLGFYELTSIFLNQTVGIPGYVPGLLLVLVGLYYSARAIRSKQTETTEAGEDVVIYTYNRVVRTLAKMGFFLCISILLVLGYSFTRSLVPLPNVLAGYVKCAEGKGPLENAAVSIVDAKHRPVFDGLEYTTDNDGAFLISAPKSVWRTYAIMVAPATGKPQFFSLANYEPPLENDFTSSDENTYTYAHCK